MDYSNYIWQGDKIRLRPLKIEDAEICFAGSLDTPSRQSLQLGTELPTTVEQQKGFLEKYKDCKDVDGIIIFGIETLESEYVGGISFHTRHRKNGTFGIGLTIYRPYWKNGYAEDAARILLNYCFFQRNYQKCNSGCIHTNEASIALHKKLGFVEEGRRKRQFFYSGQFMDDILFGLTREDFEKKI